jgi:hypothetical protein
MPVKVKISLVILLVSAFSFRSATSETMAEFITSYASLKYKKPISSLLYVGADRQKMYLIKNNVLVKVYDISTSKYGCGQEHKSEKTPVGLHKISSKIGKNCPVGGVLEGANFKGKMAVIENNPVSTGTDDLTTRAMRLTGMEKGVNMEGNKDSYMREIYIHGTPEEGLIGQPASHGCVRMRNKDIIDLFEQVDVNFYVLILEN